MPTKSEAQRRYLYMKKGKTWMKEHHFDNPGKLPDHVTRTAKHRMKKKHG